MQTDETGTRTTERERSVANGWAMLTVVLLAFVVGTLVVILSAIARPPGVILGVLILITAGIYCGGFFTVPPNTARVLLLFGEYKGTTRVQGFHWTNPFMTKRKVSLRAHNLNGQQIKVNDKAGNPIEIAAVVVWRVRDTAQAVFDVEDYEQFVGVQSETAVRHLASTHPYDGGTDEEPSLRGSAEVVAKELQRELQERLDRAGVEVIEARLSHLAYAPEIAGAMLRRQQAAAIIAARQRIVEGACGMVEMALEHLGRNRVVVLDEERKAAMVSNLLVVLCSEQAAQPVVNAGTLYT